jgi:two-component system, cell cycle sensor histidine kinase and response regulator CckA
MTLHANIILPINVVALIVCLAAAAAAQVENVKIAKPPSISSNSLKTLIVEDYYPYTFVNDEGMPDGFSVDIIQAVATVMDMKLDIDIDTWERARKALEDGTIDLLPMMASSKERMEYFDFSVPHTIAYDAVFVRKGTPKIGSIEDLANSSIIVMDRDAVHDYLLSSDIADSIELVLVDSLSDALRSLSLGEADAALMPKLVGLIVLKKLQLSNIDSSPAVVDTYNRPFSFAVKKGNQVLLERLSQGLSIIKTTGQYNDIYKKWFGSVEPAKVPWQTVYNFILGIAATLTLLALGLFLWTVSLRKQVTLRTASLEAEIQERKKAAEALRESENIFNLFMQHSPIYVFFKDENLRSIRLSKNYEQLLGRPIDKMLGETMRDNFPPDIAENIISADLRILKDGKPLTVEEEFEGRLYETIKFPIHIKGKPKYLAGYTIDITERKQAEKALRESESILREAQQLAHLGNWTWDVKTGNVKWSDEVFRIFRLDPNEFTPQIDSIMNLSPWPEDHMRDKELIQRAIESKETGSYEQKFLRPDGSVGYYYSTFQGIYDDDANLTVMKGTIQDITERKQAEEERLSLERQMQHAQKLESLGVLAGGIAHDFNNLLMAILGNADLALDELSPHAPARENIQEIEKASKRAAELAKQMLAYSGRGRFIIEPINLNEFVREMSHLLTVSISKKVLLKYNFADNLPTIEGDATQIRQIIMNLITNSSEAIGDKSGVISLSTGAMDCDRSYLNDANEVLRISLNEPLPEGAYVYLEVADTGCGMDSETIEKVFDPFFTTKFTGRGLGMSAVLGIVRGHSGALKVHSDVGKGTTFTVLFPANDLAENSSAVQNTEDDTLKEWQGEGTILIVDDEATVRTVGSMMLKRIGFNVLTAADGLEAVKIYGEHIDEIVCVLLDLTMPHLDGEQTFRQMHQINPDVKVILCSGYDEQDATEQFVGKGLTGFIQKPYTMAALRQVLQKTCQL